MQRFEVTTESDALEEADALCELISQNASTMKEGQIPAADYQIQLLAKNRNVVFRIEGRHRWYAKLPRSSRSSLVQRELLGAACLNGRLVDNPWFHIPDVIRGCREVGYLLMSEVPGRFLQTVHYSNSLRPWTGTRLRDSLRGFHHLGEALAVIHGTNVSEVAPLANHAKPSPKTAEALEELRMAVTDVGLLDRMESLTDAPRHEFIHGNLRRENIVFHRGQLGLIDFETCGRGSRYEDLAFIGCNLAQTALAWVFPWRRVYQAWNELLKGYANIRSIDYDSYSGFLVTRLIDVLAKSMAGKKPTVSRIPISTSRLRRTILTLHREGFEAAFPSVIAQSERVSELR